MGEIKFVKEKGLVERKIGNEYTEWIQRRTVRDSQAWRVNNARELVGIDAYESRHRLVFSQRGGQEPSSFTIVTRRGLRPRRTQRRHDFVLVFPGRPSTSCHYYVFSVRVISLGAAGIYRVSTEHQEIAAESPPFPRFLFFLSSSSPFFLLLFFVFFAAPL